MARRKRESGLDMLVDIAAMLPWWGGVLLAIIAYFVLHHYAATVVAPAASIAQMGNVVVSQIGKTLAMYGQYLFPFAFLLGAGISAYRQHQRASLIEDVQDGTSASVLNGMSWQEFEMLVGESFRRGGYAVTETGGGGADGGIDLVLKKDGEKFLVQCKQWKAFKVGVTTIRELYGVMAAGGAAGGFVVTSGMFTKEAKTFADGRNIDLIDGAELTSIIKIIKRQPQPSTATAQLKSQNSRTVIPEPSCPKCGKAMSKRTAKQGANIGNEFWGCTNFPQCRGTITIN